MIHGFWATMKPKMKKRNDARAMFFRWLRLIVAHRVLSSLISISFLSAFRRVVVKASWSLETASLTLILT